MSTQPTLIQSAADAVEETWVQECGGEWMSTEHSVKIVQAVLRAGGLPFLAIDRNRGEVQGAGHQPEEVKLHVHGSRSNWRSSTVTNKIESQGLHTCSLQIP